MVKQHRKIIALALGATLTVSIGGIQPVWADSGSTIQHEKELLHSNQAKLSELKSKEENQLNKLDQLKKEVQDAVNQIKDTQAEQEKTQAEINKLKKNIQETQKRINKRKDLLEKRVRLMYENGSSVQYLEVLLQSKSFTDFIGRAYALHLIAKQDKGLLDAQKADKKKEEEDKAKIQDQLMKLQSQLDSLNRLKDNLNQKVAAENNLLKEMKSKDASIQSSIHSEMQKIQSMQATANTLVAHQLNYTRSTPTHVSVGKASGSIADMISASKQWIGNSVYVFGGGRTQAQIQNGVFDCSSFVHWAYSQIGVNVGWSTSALSHEGTAVSSSSMKPGDLVFFNTYKHNGHVGIYIGGGRFIGAQSSSGVSIESLSNPYWSAHFSGTVRRIIH